MTYIIFDKNTKLYKIGKSKNVDKRLCTLKTGNLNLVLVNSYEHIQEKELHRLYKHKKIEREWYELSSQDILDIEELNFENYVKEQRFI